MAAVPSIGRASRVEAPRAAEAEATHTLYERYANQIFGYCLHQLGSREEAEDAVQSTFLNAFRGLRRGVVPELESAWLFKIAHNVCLSRRRSSWRRGRVESPADFELVEELTPAPSRRADELIGLQDVLEQMPENQRRAILLREWQGLSYREIAEELELSQAAVETLIFRARRTLAQGLEQPPESKSWRAGVRPGANVGSLITAVKSLFAGGAVKVAGTVAVVAVSSVAAPAPLEHHRETPPPQEPTPEPAAATPSSSHVASASLALIPSTMRGTRAAEQRQQNRVAPRQLASAPALVRERHHTAPPAEPAPPADLVPPADPLPPGAAVQAPEPTPAAPAQSTATPPAQPVAATPASPTAHSHPARPATPTGNSHKTPQPGRDAGATPPPSAPPSGQSQATPNGNDRPHGRDAAPGSDNPKPNGKANGTEPAQGKAAAPGPQKKAASAAVPQPAAAPQDAAGQPADTPAPAAPPADNPQPVSQQPPADPPADPGNGHRNGNDKGANGRGGDAGGRPERLRQGPRQGALSGTE